ncbi:1996_t:CDS:2, partial [Gigaspora margarita]
DEDISRINQEPVMVSKKDMNKQNHTKLIISRINGLLSFIHTSNTPNTNKFYEQWPLVLENFKKRKDQIQHDLEWKELFLRINHSKMIYTNTVNIEEKQRKKKINELIKQSIPTKNDKCNGNELSRWKKFHHLIVLLFKNSTSKDILVDFAVQQLNGLGLTVNYMYQVSEDVFKQFVDKFMDYCVQRYKDFQKNV